MTLRAVTVGENGASFGTPAGSAAISYNPAAQTLSVTVTASGLTPGPHAAHIHLGSCQNQGPVRYMLADFTADSDGNITGQTRTVTGVTASPGPGAYLNLHQGGMNQILAGGQPTLSFRPMLCTDITSVAVTGTPAAGSASPSPASLPPAPMSTSPSPAGTMPPATMPAGTTAPGTPPPAVPSSEQPTHL